MNRSWTKVRLLSVLKITYFYKYNVLEHTPDWNTTQVSVTAFQEKTISLLSAIKVQNNQILAILKNINTDRPVVTQIKFNFPMKTLEDVDVVEQLLDDINNLSALVTMNLNNFQFIEIKRTIFWHIYNHFSVYYRLLNYKILEEETLPEGSAEY